VNVNVGKGGFPPSSVVVILCAGSFGFLKYLVGINGDDGLFSKVFLCISVNAFRLLFTLSTFTGVVKSVDNGKSICLLSEG
jgi:hypothetical protein